MKKNTSICIIDDDAIYQFTIKKTIEQVGFVSDAMFFSNGEEAAKFLNKNASNIETLPDVIFLDINMPVMDGWQFLEEYTSMKYRLKKAIKIYMVTSSPNLLDMERALKISEISEYIIKPITTDKVKEIIKNIESFSNS